jgi:hypothetical protein
MKNTDYELEFGEDILYGRYDADSDILTIRKWNGVKNEVFTRMPLVFEDGGFADFCEEQGYLNRTDTFYNHEMEMYDNSDFTITMNTFLVEFNDEATQAIYKYIEQHHGEILSKK